MGFLRLLVLTPDQLQTTHYHKLNKQQSQGKRGPLAIQNDQLIDLQLLSKFRNDGWTPFHEAARGGHVNAGKWLLQQNPFLSTLVDKNGKTAQTIAREGKSWRHIEFLNWIQLVEKKEQGYNHNK